MSDIAVISHDDLDGYMSSDLISRHLEGHRGLDTDDYQCINVDYADRIERIDALFLDMVRNWQSGENRPIRELWIADHSLDRELVDLLSRWSVCIDTLYWADHHQMEAGLWDRFTKRLSEKGVIYHHAHSDGRCGAMQAAKLIGEIGDNQLIEKMYLPLVITDALDRYAGTPETFHYGQLINDYLHNAISTVKGIVESPLSEQLMRSFTRKLTQALSNDLDTNVYRYDTIVFEQRLIRALGDRFDDSDEAKTYRGYRQRLMYFFASILGTDAIGEDIELSSGETLRIVNNETPHSFEGGIVHHWLYTLEQAAIVATINVHEGSVIIRQNPERSQRDLSAIARSLGGGGHHDSAGFTPQYMDRSSIQNQIVEALEKAA